MKRINDGWYNTDWSVDPKADFVFNLATGGGMWDGPSAFVPARLGICDLAWYPGWMLRHGWPDRGYSFWPQ